MVKTTRTALEYAEAGCRTLMNKYQAEKLPPEGLFHYHQGVFLSGMEGVYYLSGNKEYGDYIKRYIDSLIDDDGNIINYEKERLDDLQPGILLFRLLNESNDKKYEKALHTIMGHIKEWPKNNAGGFWHKFIHPNQMWLDGLYMAGQIMAMYGKEYDDEWCFEEAYRQAILMWKYCRKEENGLLYHAWDESGEANWADKNTGTSSVVWGRAAGWYIVALTIILEYIPDKYEFKNELIDIVREYCTAIARYQDDKTGCWYQVVDKGNAPENWIELSCSALFVCGMSKAIRNGYIGEEFKAIIDKGFHGVIDMIAEKEDGMISVPAICVGTSVSDYDYYINRPTGENDLHGMGAFVLMCNEYHKLCCEKEA